MSIQIVCFSLSFSASSLFIQAVCAGPSAVPGPVSLTSLLHLFQMGWMGILFLQEAQPTLVLVSLFLSSLGFLIVLVSLPPVWPFPHAMCVNSECRLCLLCACIVCCLSGLLSVSGICWQHLEFTQPCFYIYIIYNIVLVVHNVICNVALLSCKSVHPERRSPPPLVCLSCLISFLFFFQFFLIRFKEQRTEGVFLVQTVKPVAANL